MGPHLDLDITFSRKVEDYLPKPKNDTVSKNDIFTYRVRNQVDFKFEGSVSHSPLLFSGGTAGVNLIHISTKNNKVKNQCELLQNILTKKTEEDKIFIEANCKKRNKSLIAKAYKGLVDFIGYLPKLVLQKLANNTRQEIHADDPMSPLALHSKLGLPIDSEIFLQENIDIAVGDIIEHTTHYSVTPLGLHFDLFEFVKPSYSRFKRLFRKVGLKKLPANKVKIEIQDIQLSGSSSELFRIEPKILGILRLKFGKGTREKFQQQSLIQSYTVDISKPLGQKFFNNILLKSYFPKIKLKAGTNILDTQEFEDVVIASAPIYKDGEGRDRLLNLKFFSWLKKKRRSHYSVQEVEFENEKVQNVGAIFEDDKERDFDLDLGLFEIKKKKIDHSCQMQSSIDHFRNKSLQIECKYSNRYASNEEMDDIHDALLISTNEHASASDLKTIKDANLDRDRVDFYTSLSFSNQGLNNILFSKADRIYLEIARMLFGENSQNVFAQKHHSAWQKMGRLGHPKLNRKDRFKDNCSEVMKKYNIIENHHRMYNEFNGIVGKNKNLYNTNQSSCYYYFTFAKSIVEDIKVLSQQVQTQSHIDNLVNLYPQMNYSAFVQNLLIRLSHNPFGKTDLRYTYVVSSPAMTQKVQASNGLPYEFNPLNIPESLFAELDENIHERIDNIKVYHRDCKKERMVVTFDTSYKFAELKNTKASLRLYTRNYRGKETLYHEVQVSLDKIQTADKSFKYQFNLPENHDWDRSYTLSLVLENEDQERLSLVNRVYVSGLDLLL